MGAAMQRATPPAHPRPGDEVVDVESGARVRVLATANAGGDLVVEHPVDGVLTLPADGWRWPWAPRSGCGCC